MSTKAVKTAISPTREEDYPEWYQQVVKAADLAENSPVRGCMIMKPWGYGMWEIMQRELDDRIKSGGVENVYFPLFIPLSFLQREAEHVEGFAKECAVVTHHRLEERDGRLVPAGELEEPLVIRPTSETIIGEAFSRWVESYRDLPLLINQWANIVRWEMRTRLFLRTTEFLWQEGHTVHANEEEAIKLTITMLETYRSFMEEVLALPVILGVKSASERFPGAVETYTTEVMMQDRKAIQAGTSHYLGQNFAKAQEIRFCNKDGELEYGYTTSWGTTTRLIGGVVMTHSDDDGMRLPPRLAPKQIVILPIAPKPEQEAEVMEYVDKVAAALQGCEYYGKPIRVTVDKRQKRGGEKNWEWIKKGVPIRIEIGPRDVEAHSVMLVRRDSDHKEKQKLSIDQLSEEIPKILADIQQNLYDQALAYREKHTRRDISDFEEFKQYFTPKNSEKPEIHGGFVIAKWCEDPESEKLLDDLKVTIRCLPLEQSETEGRCILTGKPATKDVLFAKAY
ncbi:MAG: proline--tRNA ligase [Chlamydiales bacterium]|nr:proline--tRNA ligase [Chlamydiia bacterium]MCP5507032.1 proline--tRNA ligase [Chlamydiales bacterium]